MPIHGTCAPPFAEVRAEFERNFAERGEVGASVHVTLNGESVVDLWGGIADPATSRPWNEDTVVHVWSCTKGATALCAHILASNGELDLNAPVTTYWPEFNKHGKEKAQVSQLLNHQAGLPAVRRSLGADAFYDWDLMVDVLARQEPFWEPGTRHGYHGLTFGFLVGEVVRRVTGQSLGQFFRDEVAGPLGLDFWIGLPEDLQPRVAPTIPLDPPQPGDPLASMHIAAMSDPSSIPAMQLFNTGGYFSPGESDTSAAHAAEIGAVGGITNARGLAGMYRPLALGGTVDDVRLVGEDHLVRMGAVSSAGMDAAVLVPTRFTLGFVKTIDNLHLSNVADQSSVLMSEEAFGHNGTGGAIGFADPQAGASFGYAMNQQGPGLGLNERGQALVDATYRALGYRQVPGGGTWYA